MIVKKQYYRFKSFLIKWFGDIQVFKYPFFILFGSVSYKIKGPDIRQIINTLKPGDILLRRYDKYLSGLLIPGYFTHAAIYIGDDFIIHMLGDGIVKEDILTFCRCDDIIIIRCFDETIVKNAIDNSELNLEQKIAYDFDFNFECDEKFSCTEFVNNVFANPKELKRKNKNYIIPDDFLSLDLSPNFSIIYKKR